MHTCPLCRYEKAAAQEEAAYQQQRRRLYAEVEEEKERLAVLAQQQRAELDQRARELAVSSQPAATVCGHVLDLVHCSVVVALSMVLCAHSLRRVHCCSWLVGDCRCWVLSCVLCTNVCT